MIVVYSAISILSSWFTFYLIKFYKFHPVKSSSLVSMDIFLLLLLINQFVTFDLYYLSSLAFGASFVGMCSHEKIKTKMVIFAALIFTFLYVYLVSYFSHLGGALGFSAFLAVLMPYKLSKAFRFVVPK